MKHGLVRSRFRNVYLGIILTWMSCCIVLYFIARSFIEPSLFQSRATDFESLARSQRQALLYNDNRAIRDELLRKGILKSDQDFDELRVNRPEDANRIKSELVDCHFITSQTCVGRSGALFFSEARTEVQPSFVLSLRTNYFGFIPYFSIFEALFCLLLTLLFGAAAWAIRQQESFFVAKVDLLASSFSKVEEVFQLESWADNLSLQTQDEDEFSILSQGLEQAGALLENKTAQIEQYKKTFEKKTQIEQLAKTIGYTSHNLTAPFLEGMDFFQNFPRYLESMPRDKLLLMGESLGQRFKAGSDSLKKALSQTRESYTQPEHVDLRGFITAFSKDVKRSPHYGSVNVSIDTGACGQKAKVFCSTQEMDSALWNLLLNALEAKSDAQIQIHAFTDESHAIVRFQDNGPGIPAFQRDQVFEDFFTTKPFGTGLGLGSVKETLKKYGGTIEIVPTQAGAHFEMRLPLSEVGHA
jgi:signal transduction histidine kinase